MIKTATARDLARLMVPAEFKVLDANSHSFTGLLSTWDLDLGGDLVQKGAFKRTLADWKRSKSKLIPLMDSHNWGSIRNVIGKLAEAEENDVGLLTTWNIIDGPDGEEALRRVAGGFVDSMSMGYRTIKSDQPTEEQRLQGIRRILKEVALDEGSLVVFPMNPAAVVDLDSVKTLMELDRDLTADEVKQLEDQATAISALLSKRTRSDPAPTGLAIDDPRRAALDRALLDLKIRGLSPAS